METYMAVNACYLYVYIIISGRNIYGSTYSTYLLSLGVYWDLYGGNVHSTACLFFLYIYFNVYTKMCTALHVWFLYVYSMISMVETYISLHVCSLYLYTVITMVEIIDIESL